MKNQNNNTMIDASGMSDRWINRNLAFAVAGLTMSVVLGALTNMKGIATIATLIGLR